MSKAPVYFCIQ